MYQKYGERASIYVVYIAEAHAVDEWQTESNVLEDINIPQHRTIEERLAAARQCADQLKLTIPTLVDAMDNAASRQYAAWPERIYLIGTGGRIAFKGGPGPYEFDPNAAAQALEALLA